MAAQFSTRFRFPFFRLGLLILVGSVFGSLLTYEQRLAQSASTLSAEIDRPLFSPAELRKWFVGEVLFSRSVPGVMFWVGAGLCGVGIARVVRG